MCNSMSESIIENVSWTSTLERYFADTAEKSEGMVILHSESEAEYNKKRTYIDLPVIIGSGVIAFLNAGSSALFDGEAKTSSVALGIGSLAVGIINTLGSYYSFSKLAEGHRIAAISHKKMNHFLRIEMGLPRDERMRPGDLLKMTRNEIDRLAETSPPIPPHVRDSFKKRFQNDHVSKPAEANGLHPVQIYVEEDTRGRTIELIGMDSPAIIIDKQ